VSVKKFIVICGDSFMSPVTSPGSEGTHFSEIVAKELGYDLVSLAMGGSSNTAICIQINTIFQMDPKPSLVFVNNTFHDRLEWPHNELLPDKARSCSPWTLTAKDLYYSQPESLVRTYPWVNKNSKIGNYSIGGIINVGKYEHSVLSRALNGDMYQNERMSAIKEWFTYLYHPTLQELKDTLMHIGMLSTLYYQNIPFLLLEDKLTSLPHMAGFLNNTNYVGNRFKNAIRHPDDPSYSDPGYHSTAEHQRFMADVLLQEYIPKLIKS